MKRGTSDTARTELVDLAAEPRLVSWLTTPRVTTGEAGREESGQMSEPDDWEETGAGLPVRGDERAPVPADRRVLLEVAAMP